MAQQRSKEGDRKWKIARIAKRVSIAWKVVFLNLCVPKDTTAWSKKIQKHALSIHIIRRELNLRLRTVLHAHLVISVTVLE
jgi:hypothetical protein